MVLFVRATKEGPAANAIMLQYTAPLHVALLSWPLLREPLAWHEAFPILTCVIGMACFFAGKISGGTMTGNILALAAGLTWAFHSLFLRRLAAAPFADGAGWQAELGRAIPLLVMGNVLTVVLCLPQMSFAVEFPAGTWWLLVFLGVFQLGLPFLLFTIGMGRVPAFEGILLAMLEVVFNPLWAFIGTGDAPCGPGLAGGGLIILSVVVLSYWRQQPGVRAECPGT